MAVTAAAPLDITEFDPQSQSPLFGILPGEIRNEIFALALVQYEDDTAAYPEDSYWYRPGFKCPRKSSSALLRSCRLAYLEGQKVFLKEAEHAFWFGMLSDLVFCNSLSACGAFFSAGWEILFWLWQDAHFQVS